MRDVGVRALPWPLLVAVAGMRRDGRGTIAAAALAVAACALLTALAGVTGATEPAVLRAVLADAPAARTEVVVQVVRPAGQPQEVAARAARAVGRLVGAPRTPPVSAGALSTAMTASGSFGDATTSLAAVGADAARTVDGALPAGPSTGAVPVVVPVASGLVIGDRFALTSAGGTASTARVVGRYRPIAAASFWQRDPLGAQGRVEVFTDPDSRSAVPGPAFGPLLVAPADLARAGATVGSLEVVVRPDLARVDAAALPGVARRLADAEQEVVPAVGASGGAVVVDTAAPGVLLAASAGVARTRGLTLITGALVVALAIAVLVLLARLVAAARAGERLLLLARGADRGSLVVAQAVEAAAIALPAALLGPPLAVGLVRVLLSTRGAEAAGVVPPAVPTGTMWAVAGAAAVLLAAVQVVAAAGGARRDPAGRAARTGVLVRSGLDVAVLALGLVALQVLLAARGPVTGAAAVAPVALLVAAALLAGRALGPLGRVAEVLAARSRSVVPALAAFALARRSRTAAATLLVVALGTGGSAFATGVLATWRASQADQAAVATGPPARTGAGGAAGTPVSRVDATVTGPVTAEGADTSAAAVLALPPAARALLRRQTVGAVGGRAVAAGLDPAGAARALALPGTATALIVPVGRSVRLSAVLRTADDRLVEVAGRQAADGDVSIALPAGGPLSLAGFAITAPADSPPLRVRVEDVRTDSGTALTLPDGWSAVPQDPAARPLDAVRTATGYSLGLPESPLVATTVRLLGWSRTSVVPAVADRRLAARAGLRTGALAAAAVAGGTVPVLVVAVVPAVPADPSLARLRRGGTEPALPLLVVDRERLARALVEQGGSLGVDERWLAAPRSGAVDAAATTRRLLDAPLGVGVPAATLLLVAAGLLLLAVTAVVQAIASRRERRVEIAQLRAAGTSEGRLAAVDALVAAVVGVIGGAAGVAVGLALAAVTAPALITAPSGAASVPAVRPVLPAELAAALLVVAVAVPVTAALVAARADRRVAPAAVLRAGEPA